MNFEMNFNRMRAHAIAREEAKGAAKADIVFPLIQVELTEARQNPANQQVQTTIVVPWLEQLSFHGFFDRLAELLGNPYQPTTGFDEGRVFVVVKW